MKTTPIKAAAAFIVMSGLTITFALRVHELSGDSRARAEADVAGLPTLILEKRGLETRAASVRNGQNDLLAQRELETQRAGIVPRLTDICQTLGIKTDTIGLHEQDTIRLSATTTTIQVIDFLHQVETQEPMLRLKESRWQAVADGVYVNLLFDVWTIPSTPTS